MAAFSSVIRKRLSTRSSRLARRERKFAQDLAAREYKKPGLGYNQFLNRRYPLLPGLGVRNPDGTYKSPTTRDYIEPCSPRAVAHFPGVCFMDLLTLKGPLVPVYD